MLSSLAAVIVVAGCAPAHVAQVDHAGLLRLAISSEPHSLNPIFSQSIPENDIVRLMFDPLVAADAKGNLIPALAAQVPTRENGGISADVAFSTRAVLDPKNNVASRRGYDTIASFVTPDRYTVRYRLKRRFAPFVATVFSESDSPYYLVPAHLSGAANEHSTFSSRPIGTGPFAFVSWKRNDALQLMANDNYFRGSPKLRRITVRFVPDENTEIAQVRSGEIDGVLNIGANAAALLKDIPSVRVIATPVNGYFGLMFNLRHVSDMRVRRALAEAIDAAAFRANIVHGYYGPTAGDLPSFLWAADPSLHPIPHNPEDARKLLTAAGYSPLHPLKLDLAIITGFRTYESWSVLLQAELRPYGVDVQIHRYLGQLFAAPATEHGILAGGRYNAAVYGWTAGIDPDDSSQFMCDQRPPVGFNDAFYCDPEMDAAQRIALGNYDQRVRKRAYATIERLLQRDVPIVFVANTAQLTVLHNDLHGFAPNSVTMTSFAEQWSF